MLFTYNAFYLKTPCFFAIWKLSLTFFRKQDFLDFFNKIEKICEIVMIFRNLLIV